MQKKMSTERERSCKERDDDDLWAQKEVEKWHSDSAVNSR